MLQPEGQCADRLATTRFSLYRRDLPNAQVEDVQAVEVKLATQKSKRTDELIRLKALGLLALDGHVQGGGGW